MGVLSGCLPRPALSLLALNLTPSGEFTWGQRLVGWTEAQSCLTPRRGGECSYGPTPRAHPCSPELPHALRPLSPSPGSPSVPQADTSCIQDSRALFPERLPHPSLPNQHPMGTTPGPARSAQTEYPDGARLCPGQGGREEGGPARAGWWLAWPPHPAGRCL